MILDTIGNLSRYYPVHRLFPIVSEFVFSRYPGGLECGHITLGCGIKASINEYTTILPDTGQLESHMKYIDLQLVLAGKEMAGYCNRDTCTETGPYNEEKDVSFHCGPVDFFILAPDRFALFFPHDAHIPGLAVDGTTGPVRKLVIKIPV